MFRLQTFCTCPFFPIQGADPYVSDLLYTSVVPRYSEDPWIGCNMGAEVIIANVWYSTRNFIVHLISSSGFVAVSRRIGTAKGLVTSSSCHIGTA